MKLSKFCPRCGEETDKLHGDKKKLCSSCFTDENDLIDLPDVVEITTCTVCGRMKKNGEWLERFSVEEQLGEKFAEYNEEDFKMELQYWEGEDRTMVRLHISKDGIEDEYDTELRFNKTQCNPCSKFSSGFYKVKMQIRGDDVDGIVEKAAEKAAEATNQNRNDFLSNIEYNEHGADLYLSTESIAKKLIETVKTYRNPDIRRSYELAGEEDGQKVYRNVISVRI